MAAKKRKIAQKLQSNAAIFFNMDGYDTSRQALMGRHAAGEGFLHGFARHADVDTYVCLTHSQKSYEDFCNRIQPFAKPEITRQFVSMGNLSRLSDVGALFLPGPSIGEYAWLRRFGDQRGFSLTGVTHTTATLRVMSAVTDFLTAPIQPWDALVCTSQSVVTSLQKILDQQAAYLSERFKTQINPDVKLPMIPLGVHAEQYARTNATDQTRAELRSDLGADDNTIVCLFHGRLSWMDKHNPVAMLRALQMAQQETDKTLMLVLSGWFIKDEQQKTVTDAIKALAPNVQVRHVDGRAPEVRKNIWFAADLFISLIDNIQETFGLTPIEAMAAGLPVVATDWDGYRDTIRNGIDGFRIPTIMPPPGYGQDLAFAHAAKIESYPFYVGATALSTAVDLQQAKNAILTLAHDQNLRRTMGANGRARAKTVYDWAVIIKQYQDLWAELTDIRKGPAVEIAQREPHHPAAPQYTDPYDLFDVYPTDTLQPDTRLSVSVQDPSATEEKLRTVEILGFAARTLLPADMSQQILSYLVAHPKCTIADVLEKTPETRHRQLMRSIGWWLKVGILSLSDPQEVAIDAPQAKTETKTTEHDPKP